MDLRTITHHTESRELIGRVSAHPPCFRVAVKVIVFLTMPPLPESDSISRQLEYLQRFKAAFLEDEALGVIVAMMEEPLAHLER